MTAEPVTLALCGDVMLGRGVDQILPFPGDPELREPYVQDARIYVGLAESANGPVHHPVAFRYPWGDALAALDAAEPDARVLNLETSVTRHGTFAPGREIHYRMHPANLPCLVAARPDVCVLSNNHVLDFGREGLAETLRGLAAAGLRSVGAGADVEAARRPAVVRLPGGHRLLVLALGMPSSGIPRTWAATARHSGVHWADGPTPTTAAAVAAQLRARKRIGDLAMVSVHWGSNWGYGVPHAQTACAHALIDAGVDLVHGHSSHHPRPVEVYQGKLILHGCGDFIDDYEGITGYERYRDDLRPLYLAALEPGTGRLQELRIVPFQAHRMRLRHASAEDARWLGALFDRLAGGFAPGALTTDPAPVLTLRPA